VHEGARGRLWKPIAAKRRTLAVEPVVDATDEFAVGWRCYLAHFLRSILYKTHTLHEIILDAEPQGDPIYTISTWWIAWRACYGLKDGDYAICWNKVVRKVQLQQWHRRGFNPRGNFVRRPFPQPSTSPPIPEQPQDLHANVQLREHLEHHTQTGIIQLPVGEVDLAGDEHRRFCSAPL
jgi:hypothetical protein